MRAFYLTPLILFGLGLCSCDQVSSRNDSSAREAGRQAYRASQEAKRDAKEAAKQLESASKEFRDGWEEAKHSSPPRETKRKEPERRDDH